MEATASDAGPGLRERKKAATRQALHEAAARLAAEHGIDQVTVEAIADAAAVSRRTFSNYFSSKEEAVLYGEVASLRRLVALLRERPAGEPPREALGRAAVALVDQTHVDAGWVARRRLLRGQPTLVAHQVAAYAAVERDLAAELDRRLGDGGRDAAGLRARVLAATTMAALRAATQRWIDEPDRSLPELVSAALRYAAEP